MQKNYILIYTKNKTFFDLKTSWFIHQVTTRQGIPSAVLNVKTCHYYWATFHILWIATSKLGKPLQTPLQFVKLLYNCIKLGVYLVRLLYIENKFVVSRVCWQ